MFFFFSGDAPASIPKTLSPSEDDVGQFGHLGAFHCHSKNSVATGSALLLRMKRKSERNSERGVAVDQRGATELSSTGREWAVPNYPLG